MQDRVDITFTNLARFSASTQGSTAQTSCFAMPHFEKLAGN